MTTQSISSPCIRVCAVDGATGWCIGCGRHLSEIGNWTKLGEDGRERVMAELPARLETLAVRLKERSDHDQG